MVCYTYIWFRVGTEIEIIYFILIFEKEGRRQNEFQEHYHISGKINKINKGIGLQI